MSVWTRLLKRSMDSLQKLPWQTQVYCFLTCCLELISDFQGSYTASAELWMPLRQLLWLWTSYAITGITARVVAMPHYSQGNGRDTHRYHSALCTNTWRPLQCPGEEAEPASCVIFTPNSWHHCNYGKMLDKHQLRAILQITDQGSQVMSGAGEAGVSVCAGHQSKSPFTGRLQHMNLGAGRAGRKRGPLSNRVWARLHPGIAHWVLEHRKDSGGSADEDGSLRSWGQGHSDIIHCTSLKKNLV